MTWLAWTAVFTAVLVVSAGRDLGNWRPVSGDESWIIAPSYKLAQDGTFGSDMHAGFHHADERYFISLPGVHVAQALVFRIAGAGIIQARSVSLAAAVVLLWTVCWLAWRWFGAGAAALTGLLLIFWRANTLGIFPGLSLLPVARLARYDLLAVTCIWLAIAALDRTVRRPPPLPALMLGLAAAAATLTQFFGVFVFVLIAVVLLAHGNRRELVASVVPWTAIGAAALLLPYALYALRYWDDFRGQSALKSGRVEFGSPSFYLDNLLAEPDRYRRAWEQLLDTSSGFEQAVIVIATLMLLAGVGVAVFSAWSRRSDPSAFGIRLCALSLLVFGAGLALFESVKATLYLIAVLPSVCMLAAVGWVLCWGWAERVRAASPLRVGAKLILVGVLAVIVAHGLRGYQLDADAAQGVPEYQDVAAFIDAHLEPGARVIGPERWWWGLREHPYRAHFALWYAWLDAAPDSDGRNLAQAMRLAGDYVLVNDGMPYIEGGTPPELQRQFDEFMRACTALAFEYGDRAYGEIRLYRIVPVESLRCASLAGRPDG